MPTPWYYMLGRICTSEAFFSELVAVDERGRALMCTQCLFDVEFVCMAGMQNYAKLVACIGEGEACDDMFDIDS